MEVSSVEKSKRILYTAIILAFVVFILREILVIILDLYGAKNFSHRHIPYINITHDNYPMIKYAKSFVSMVNLMLKNETFTE